MTAFLTVPALAAWLRDTGLEMVLDRLTKRVEDDFRRWLSFELVPRLASHSPVGVIELMPTSDGETYTVKYVNGHPSNPLRGLQTVTAFGVLADVETGYPRLLTEMTVLTALRTAATSAMAAKYLVGPSPSTMALIGTGAQAEFQAIAMRRALGVRRLRAWDVDPRALEKLVGNLEPLGFEVVVAASGEEATSGADIITTCTADKAHATVLHDEMVEPGTFVNAIGGDCPGKTELDPRILERASVFVEFEPQTRIEGELQQMDASFEVTELWRVVRGEALGRTSPEDITVFDSVGFAVEDFTALRFVYEATRETDYVVDLDLVADPADPKNLYGLALGPAFDAAGHYGPVAAL